MIDAPFFQSVRIATFLYFSFCMNRLFDILLVLFVNMLKSMHGALVRVRRVLFRRHRRRLCIFHIKFIRAKRGMNFICRQITIGNRRQFHICTVPLFSHLWCASHSKGHGVGTVLLRCSQFTSAVFFDVLAFPSSRCAVRYPSRCAHPIRSHIYCHLIIFAFDSGINYL